MIGVARREWQESIVRPTVVISTDLNDRRPGQRKIQREKPVQPVCAAGCSDATKARQTIADDGAASIQAALGAGLDLGAPKAPHSAQLEAHQPALGGSLDARAVSW